jgi:hypothetical protein
MRDDGILYDPLIEDQMPTAWLNANRLAMRSLESSRRLLIFRSLRRHFGHEDWMR